VKDRLERLDREREEAHRTARLKQGADALQLAQEANNIAEAANRHAGHANWIALAAAALAVVALVKSCGIL